MRRLQRRATSCASRSASSRRRTCSRISSTHSSRPPSRARERRPQRGRVRRDPDRLAEQVRVRRGARRHRPRPAPVHGDGVSRRLRLCRRDARGGRRPARRSRARLRPDVPRLPHPRTADRRLPHERREGPGREAAVRSARRPVVRAHPRHPRRHRRAARRDRTLLPALQGSRAGEEDGNARLGKPLGSVGDHRRGPRARFVTALEPIDLLHQGHERSVGCYLLDTDDGPALFDCGPTSTVETLGAALADRGLHLTDVRHLLLSHIHLDHAGAAGVLVRRHPALQVHVSEIGAPHLVEPERLERSARRLYGDAFDTLWGELAPVPKQNVHVAGDRVVGLDCFPTPGHASHHISYLDRDGTLYAGDAAGVRIQPGRYVMPPTPPPDVDVDGWERTIDELERRNPERLALIHFGVADDPARHLAELRLELLDWAEFVLGGASEEEFVAYCRAELADAGEPVGIWDHAMPFWQSYQGLKRWADKQADLSPAS